MIVAWNDRTGETIWLRLRPRFTAPIPLRYLASDAARGLHRTSFDSRQIIPHVHRSSYRTLNDPDAHAGSGFITDTRPWCSGVTDGPRDTGTKCRCSLLRGTSTTIRGSRFRNELANLGTHDHSSTGRGCSYNFRDRGACNRDAVELPSATAILPAWPCSTTVLQTKATEPKPRCVWRKAGKFLKGSSRFHCWSSSWHRSSLVWYLSFAMSILVTRFRRELFKRWNVLRVLVLLPFQSYDCFWEIYMGVILETEMSRNICRAWCFKV